jgi:hypothetical protein
MRLNRKLVLGTVAGLAVAGAGGAVAATQLGSSPKEESQAIINDAASRLGIQPSKLSDALKKAFENRIDAAVQAGRLTKAEGDALKQRIESGDLPLFLGGPPMRHVEFGPFGHKLDAAASYLGLTEAQLRTKLESGKTLAQIAKDQGKSVDGLVQALVNAAKTHLDADVKAGRLTQAQADSILKDLKQHITDFVNGNFPGPGRFEFHGPPGGFRGPMGGPPQGFRSFGPGASIPSSPPGV